MTFSSLSSSSFTIFLVFLCCPRAWLACVVVIVQPIVFLVTPLIFLRSGMLPGRVHV